MILCHPTGLADEVMRFHPEDHVSAKYNFEMRMTVDTPRTMSTD